MAITLDLLAAECREALAGGEEAAALETVCAAVKRALADPAFLQTVLLSRDAPPERTVLFEDPDLGFCICAHVYSGAKPGSPHDHGPTWAVYGQAEGETVMTDWEIIRPAEGDRPAGVSQVRRYELKPGDARVYPTGAIHAPYRDGPTRLLRIEGRNTDTIARTPLEVVA